MAKPNMEFKSLTASDVGKLLKDGEISIRGSKAVIVMKRKVRGGTKTETIHLALQPAIVEVEVPEAAEAPKKAKKRGPKPKKTASAETPEKVPKKRGPKPKKPSEEETAEPPKKPKAKKRGPKKKKGKKPAAKAPAEGPKKPKTPAKPKKPAAKKTAPADRPPKTSKAKKPAPSLPWANADDFSEDEFEM